MKLIIAGSRGFSSVQCFNILNEVVNKFIKDSGVSDNDIDIISGCAKGADELGAEYAESKGYPIIECPANWIKHGNSAGPIRNEEMAKIATHCICFWDGESKGTRNMIETAKKYNLKTLVIQYQENLNETN